MFLPSQKILVVADGPGVMTHTAPLLMALQKQGYDAAIATTESARLFTTPYFPALLTNHPAIDWHVADLSPYGAIVFAPCAESMVRKLLIDLMRKDSLLACYLKNESAETDAPPDHSVLIAPAWLSQNDADAARETLAESFAPYHHAVSLVYPDGDTLSLGALGALSVAAPNRCAEALRQLQTTQDFAGKRILITAGPTAEDADPVRYVTNRSTGKMGAALAQIAARRGADVTVVHGPMPTPLPSHPAVHSIAVRSAQQMFEKVMELAPTQDIAILCAAVADYTPVTYSDIKIKKGSEATFALLLKRTPDILAAIGNMSDNKPFLVGFAAESDHVEQNALGKLRGKSCDLLCANDITEPGSGFAVDTNRVTVFHKNGKVTRLPMLSKIDTARKLFDIIREEL